MAENRKPKQPTLAQRRAATAKRMLEQSSRETGTIKPARPRVPFMRVGGVPVPAALLNRAGQAIKESPVLDIPLGGVGQLMENVGTPFYRPKDSAAAMYDLAARRFMGLVPNPLEDDRR
jgi:hypothetical protein